MASQKRGARLSILVTLTLVVITLVAAALPGSSAYAEKDKCKFKYKVQAGDTLNYIGNLYQVKWELIAEANDLNPPYSIAVGQVLCIPGGTAPNTTTTTTTTTGTSKKGPSLEVLVGLGDIQLIVKKFAKNTPYFVRIFPRSSSASFKIGQLVTDKNGDFTGFFDLPLYVQRTPQMILCLKNAWTDKSTCVRYGDPWVPPFPIIGRCPTGPR